MPLIGIDVGTTGCKCTVFGDDGGAIGYAYREYSFEESAAGHRELDMRKVWDCVKSVVREASQSGPAGGRAAIAISSIGEACVPVDIRGNVLSNSIMYTDGRGVAESEYLVRRLGAHRIMEITGLPAHSMYTVCKLMWMKENMPEVFGRAWKFLLFGDFVAYKMTGSPVIDYSLASRTMAFDVTKKAWSHEILEAAGIGEGLFSEPKPAGTVIGTLAGEAAGETGLPPDTVVVAGGHDQACAALGAGVVRERCAVYGMGTAHCITTAFGNPNMGGEMRKRNFNCEPHLVDGMYLSLAFCFSGGALLKWYQNRFAAKEAEAARQSGAGIYEYMDGIAAGGPTGILVLPHFSSAGTPYMDPYAKGAVVGLTLDTTAGQLYRALQEGVAYEMRYNLECLSAAGIGIDTLRAVGGGARSALWPQIAADVLGKSIETLNIEESGTLATAVLAGKALGVFGSCREALNRLVRVKRTYTPDASRHDEYTRHYEKYKKVYDSVKNILN